METSSESVLLIEDDLKLAKLFSEALEAGQIICHCAHQANAVQVAAAWQPGLILLDAGLYHMDGLAALTRLRRNKRTAELPVVILSGNTERRVINRLLAQGVADNWALHELSPGSLVERVDEWFSTHNHRVISRLPAEVLLQPKRNRTPQPPRGDWQRML